MSLPKVTHPRYPFLGGPLNGRAVMTERKVKNTVRLPDDDSGSYCLISCEFLGPHYKWRNKRGPKPKGHKENPWLTPEYQASRKKALKDRGLCIRCRAPRGDSKSEVFCDSCLARHAATQRRLKRKNRGPCPICGCEFNDVEKHLRKMHPEKQ